MSPKPLMSLLVVLYFAFPSAKAQQKNLLINSGELIAQSSELQQKEKYKEAMALLQQISRSDTGYADALYELGYCALSDTQYNAAYQYAMEGMRIFAERKIKFLLLAASALDDMDKPDEAVAMYTQAMATYPHEHLLYFNRGISQYRMNKLEAAAADFETAILINPYYSSSHYYRGALYMQQGKLVPAILAYQTYLMLAPDGRHRNKVITDLLAISKITDEIRELATKNPSKAKDPFAPIQDILLSKIALDKQYQLKADLEDNIVRQIQVVNEQVQYIASDKSFAMQVYVPLYESIFKQNMFEPMIFNIFSGMELEKVDNWLKKNKKQSGLFVDTASNYLDLVRSSRELEKHKRNTVNVHYLFDGGNFSGKGLLNNRAQSLYTGAWEFFHSNGMLKSKGRFNAAEEKEGEWLFYYENGQLNEKAQYVNGKQDGLAEGWFDNGNPWYKSNYINDTIEGTLTTFYYNGLPRSVTEYKNGKKNGMEKLYSTKGLLTDVTLFEHDIEEGKAFSYHENGQISAEVGLRAGKKEGLFKSWHSNGKLETEGNFVADKRQGLWITYYKDGAVKEKATYKDDELIGEFTEYHPNGMLTRKGNYARKKLDGKTINYDDDGKKYQETVFDNGRLKAVNFFDKSGQQISANAIQKNNAAITFFTPWGIKLAKGVYNNQGERDGAYIIYFPSGKESSHEMYKNGEQEGSSITFYTNGQKNMVTHFQANEENGYSQGYYFNGKPQYDGWIIKGQKQQTFNFYNVLGDLTAQEHFLNNKLNGWITYYNPGNKPDYVYKYSSGWLDSLIQMDSTGKIMTTNVFKAGKGPMILKHYNGKNRIVGKYEHYMLTGPYTTYYMDGSIKSTLFYDRGEVDSTYKEYYFGGKIQSEGQYKNGKAEGEWKHYYPDGKLKRIDHYTDGEQTGESISYSPKGHIEANIPFKEGKINGDYKVFAENNQLVVSMLFKEDNIESYTYEGKDGKLVTPIVFKGNGQLTAYYKNGNLSATMNFSDNIMDGNYVLYYPDGKKYVNVHISNGQEDGKRIFYYPDGKIWKEDDFVLGKYHGSRKAYYTNGQLKSEEKYYDDEEHGTCAYYNEQGQLTQTRVYYYGTLQAVQ